MPVADNIGEVASDESFEQIQPVPELKLEVSQEPLLEQDVFFKQIEDELKAKANGGKKLNSLVFLHGFNNEFKSAAGTAAVFSAGLNPNGVTAMFSWPSAGDLLAYAADGASIEASEKAIVDFLKRLAMLCVNYGQLHVIAHSMGNRGLLRALQLIAEDSKTSQTVKFGQIIHAAPDVDRHLFLDLTRYCFGEDPQQKKPVEAKRVTLYAAKDDDAVGFSEFLNKAPRAGIFPPYTANQNTFDSVGVFEKTDSSGHSYLTSNKMVRDDTKLLIDENKSPEERVGMTADKTLREKDSHGVWVIKANL